MKDQVIFRDGMISLQSRFETVLFQKCENNGVLIGETLMRSPDMKAALAELRGEIL